MFFATHEVFSPFDSGPDVHAFETRRERDSFVEHGPRYAYELVYPYEQKAVTAAQARKLAKADDYGDKYAIKGRGHEGVLYPWGNAGYTAAMYPCTVRVIAGSGTVTAIVPATVEEAARIVGAGLTKERTLLTLELLSKAQRERREIEYIKGV